MSENDMIELFDGDLNYMKFLKSAQRTVKCEKCEKIQTQELSEKLNCGHLYCKTCLNQYLNTSADLFYDEMLDFKCPLCGDLISEVIIKSNLEADKLKSYLKKLHKHGASDLNQNCAECDYEFTVKKIKKKHVCPKCSRNICSSCNSIYFKGCCFKT